MPGRGQPRAGARTPRSTDHASLRDQLRRDLRGRARRQEPADGARVRHPLPGVAGAHRHHHRDGHHPRRLGRGGEPRGEPPAHGHDHDRRRPRVPRVRGVDAAGRHPGRGRRDGRGRGGTAGGGGGDRRHRGHVPARRAGRQDHARDHHARHPGGRARHLAGVDPGHGGRRRPRHRGRPPARRRACPNGSCGSAPRPSSSCSGWRSWSRERSRSAQTSAIGASCRWTRGRPAPTAGGGTPIPPRGGSLAAQTRVPRNPSSAEAAPPPAAVGLRPPRRPAAGLHAPADGPGPRRQPAGDGGHGGRLDRLRRHHDHPAVHQQRHAEHALHQRSGVLPARGDPADQLGDGVPRRPARVPRPDPRPPPGAPCGHRRPLQPLDADPHGARARLQGGGAGHPSDAPLGRAAGVPVPAHRAPDRRSAGPHRRPRPAAPHRGQGPARPDHRPPARAPCLGRGGARHPRAPGGRRPCPHDRPGRGGRRGVPPLRLLAGAAGRPGGRVGGRPHRRVPRRPRARPPRRGPAGRGRRDHRRGRRGHRPRPGPPPPAPPSPGVDVPHRGGVRSSASGTPTSRTSPTRR